MKWAFRFIGCIAAVTVSGCHCGGKGTGTTFGEVGIVYTQSDGTQLTGPNGTYDFGKVGMGKSSTTKITIRNLGNGPLELQSVDKASGDNVHLDDMTNEMPPVFEWPFVAQTIGVGGEYDIDATFDAPIETDPSITSKDHQAIINLHVGLVAPGSELSTVTLTGTAISGQCDLPERIDFGAVAVNDTFAKTVPVQNNTPIGATGSVGSITSNSGDDTSFTFGDNSVQGVFNIPAGATKNVIIQFTPTHTGDFLAFVTMQAADECPKIPVTLVGSGVSSVLACTPVPLDFGYLTPGLTTQKALTLTNAGFAPISVTGAVAKVGTTTSTEFKVVGPDSFTVPPATRDDGGTIIPGSLDVQMTFTPALLGTRQGNLVGTTTLAKQPMLACGLRGVGGGPDIDVKPNALNFGQIPFFPPMTGQTPFFATRKITIQNLGTAPSPADPKANLHIGKLGVGPTYWDITPKNADSPVSAICLGDYDTGTNTCSNAPPAIAHYSDTTGIIAAGASALLDIPVRIQPVVAGKDLEWDVTIYSDDPDEPAVVVNIKAQSVTLPPCNYKVTPSTLNFGLVTPPAYRDLAFTITNVGQNATDTCLILGMDLKPGTDPAFSLPAGAVTQQLMMPGESFPVTVRAAPQVAGSSTPISAMGAVALSMSSPTTPETDIALQASIGTSCLIIAPNDLDFGTVQKDCNSAKHTFNVYNTCSTNVTVQSFGMQAGAGQPAGGPNCPGATACPEFLVDGTPSFMGTPVIAAGNATPATFTLKYHPIDLGTDSGAFVIKVSQNSSVVDYVVTLHGKGDTQGLNVDTFHQDQKPKADILLVVDNSCSMSDKQMALAQNFLSFIQYAQTASVDYHIGVVDTDFECGPNVGKLHGDATNPKVLTPTTNNVTALFAAKVNVGVNACGNEAMAEPATRALTAPLITTDNAGFLRADAVLAIVVVSDAGDQSPNTAAYYENQLRNIKGAQHANQFTYNDIGPFNPNPPPPCMYDDFTDVSVNEALVTTFNGVKEEICTPDWSTSLQNLGKIAFGYRTNFFLNTTPDLTGTHNVTVAINGTTLAQTDSRGAPVWSYDSSGNAVVFQPLFVPEPGDVLTVTYYVTCN